MARRVKILSFLAFISISLFIAQLFMAFGGSDRTTYNFQQMGTNTSTRASISSSVQYAGSRIGSLNEKSVLVSHHHEGHDGFELGMTVRNICQIAGNAQISSGIKALFTIPSKRLLYCPVEKIGTTYWRRLFYMLLKADKKYENPYDITIETALRNSNLFTRNIRGQKETEILFKSSFSFLIVRNPYSRLLSAFVDKLLPPNPTYWKGFGVKAIQAYRKLNRTIPVDGHDVTFEEFVRHVVNSEKTGKNLDEHFMSIWRSCRPCQFKFDYIGKMETFKTDAVFIMDKIGLNTSVDSIQNKFRDLSVDDAIQDSINSPFKWKKDVLKSISWDKALKRIWLKLQIRGIIAMEKKLEINNETLEMNANAFIELARKAHRESNPVDLKNTKTTAKREAFASVPVDVMKEFRSVFIHDFNLFGYDDSPSYIFDRKEDVKNVLVNYTHLN